MSDVPSYVVDASSVVKWYLRESDSEQALQILRDYRQGRISLLAPDRIRHEVPAALWRAVFVRKLVSRDDGRLLIESFQGLKLPTLRSESLVLMAYDLTFEYGCSLYDGFYVAAASVTQDRLITADDKLYPSLYGKFPFVERLQDDPWTGAAQRG
ncbi:MAG: type II toxin-antitoxin system VapC family toxin [Chloroflexota bacterium]